jgi:hypothetical protein
MKTKLLMILNYTEKDYDRLVLESFIAWCSEQQLYSDNHFQLLLTNNKLYNWFMQEYQNREKAFLYLVKHFIGKSSTRDLRALYDSKTAQISFYPKAILDQIFKNVKLNASKPIHNQPIRTSYTLN